MNQKQIQMYKYKFIISILHFRGKILICKQTLKIIVETNIKKDQKKIEKINSKS